jgi:tetratricopeptide (TPR) repeat protein
LSKKQLPYGLVFKLSKPVGFHTQFRSKLALSPNERVRGTNSMLICFDTTRVTTSYSIMRITIFLLHHHITTTRDRAPIAFHGELTATELVPKLRSRFEELGIQQGLDILDQKEELEDKLKSLCRDVFKTHPFLLLLDDFEQNLELCNSHFCVKDQFLPVVRGLLSGLPWCNNMSALIFTSRYPFVLEHGGSDLVQKHLENIPLMSFRDADLDKKVRELSHISASSHFRLYLNAGKGNPRLLEWLDAIAAEEKLYDLHDLEKKIAGQTDDFVRAYLANLIASAHGNDFHTFLSRASVFRCPVPESAFAEIGSPDLLHLGVRLTLCEKEDDNAGNILYWVNPVIREDQWNRLGAQEQRRMHEAAFGWYDKECRSKEEKDKDPQYLEEAVFHGLECDKVIESCNHAIWLGDYFEKAVLYREKRRALQSVADRITTEVKTKAIEEKEGDVGGVMNNLGSVFADLGDNRKAIEYYTGALEIDLAVFGDKHPKVAIRYNNLGAAWRALGDANKAIEYYTRALDIDVAVYGDKHPNVAIRYNNLGSAWDDLGDKPKSRDYYTRALAIFEAVYGPDHPSIKTVRENLESLG